jgi:hypothetical protein
MFHIAMQASILPDEKILIEVLSLVSVISDYGIVLLEK